MPGFDLTKLFVNMINGKTGVVKLDAEDVHALPDDTVIPEPSDALPQDLGTASAGTSDDYARADHVHNMSGSSSEIASIVFPAVWADSGNGYYTSAPTISGVTLSAESKIDLQITAAQFLTLQADGVENLYVENNNAALTAYAVGGYPSAAVTLQCTITGTQAPTPPVNPSLDMIYPIGSVYTNVSNVNPGNTIGGTWERLEIATMYSEWELAGTSTSSSQLVTYPADATELYIEFTSNYDSASVGGGGIYLVDKIQTLKVILVSGYYYASSDSGIINVNHDANNRTISFRNLRYVSTTSGTISVYSRKMISNGLYVWKRTA